MGSAATADARVMRAVVRVLARRGLFFLDSRTTDATVAGEAAREERVPAVSRRVFLDDVATEAEVSKAAGGAHRPRPGRGLGGGTRSSVRRDARRAGAGAAGIEAARGQARSGGCSWPSSEELVIWIGESDESFDPVPDHTNPGT